MLKESIYNIYTSSWSNKNVKFLIFYHYLRRWSIIPRTFGNPILTHRGQRKKIHTTSEFSLNLEDRAEALSDTKFGDGRSSSKQDALLYRYDRVFRTVVLGCQWTSEVRSILVIMLIGMRMDLCVVEWGRKRNGLIISFRYNQEKSLIREIIWLRSQKFENKIVWLFYREK